MILGSSTISAAMIWSKGGRYNSGQWIFLSQKLVINLDESLHAQKYVRIHLIFARMTDMLRMGLDQMSPHVHAIAHTSLMSTPFENYSWVKLLFIFTSDGQSWNETWIRIKYDL